MILVGSWRLSTRTRGPRRGGPSARHVETVCERNCNAERTAGFDERAPPKRAGTFRERSWDNCLRQRAGTQHPAGAVSSDGKDLTRGGNQPHNPDVVAWRRKIAGMFVLLASVSFAGSTCDGWQASASGRMACCADEEHPCSQLAADACCGSAELRQHATQSAAMPAPITALPLAAFPSILEHQPDLREALVDLPSPRMLGSPPETHLLLTVFLI